MNFIAPFDFCLIKLELRSSSSLQINWPLVRHVNMCVYVFLYTQFKYTSHLEHSCVIHFSNGRVSHSLLNEKSEL